MYRYIRKKRHVKSPVYIWEPTRGLPTVLIWEYIQKWVGIHVYRRASNLGQQPTPSTAVVTTNETASTDVKTGTRVLVNSHIKYHIS